VRHHGLDIVTPSAALFPIEDHIGNRNLPNLGLIGSLESNRPNQVVTIINALAELMTPRQSQNDQGNDESVAQFVRCGRQFSNPQLPHYHFVPRDCKSSNQQSYCYTDPSKVGMCIDRVAMRGPLRPYALLGLKESGCRPAA
jgi:hypothetical protein